MVHAPTRPATTAGRSACSPSLPYIDFDFATRTSGQPFNCGAPVNDSPHNTGLRVLPAVQQPQFWYTYEARTPCAGAYLQNPPTACDFKWPVIGTGGVGPHGGPIYNVRQRVSTSETKFPEYYNDSVVFGEFTRDKLFMMRTDGKGNLIGVEQFLPGVVVRQPDGDGVRPGRQPLRAGVRRRLLPRRTRTRSSRSSGT